MHSFLGWLPTIMHPLQEVHKMNALLKDHVSAHILSLRLFGGFHYKLMYVI
jgi:hypothetical protein